jgi:hypothetical protein
MSISERTVRVLLVGALVLLCAVSNVSAIPTDFIAGYNLDGNANDITSNYNGTNNGATVTSDKDGNPDAAMSFNSNDYIQTPLNLVGLSALSVSMWVKFDNHKTFNYLMADEVYAGPWNYVLENRAGTIQYYLDTNQPSQSVIDGGVKLTGAAAALGSWMHIATTWDGSQTNLFINGSLVDTAAISGVFNINKTVNFGSWDGRTRFLDGDLDSIYIYDYGLTTGQVEELYTQSPVPEPATIVLLGMGLFGLAGVSRRRIKSVRGS